MKNALKLIAVFVLIFVGLFSYVYSSTSEVRALGNSFVHHIGANEIDQAYGMLHKSMQAKISLPEFTQQIVRNKLNTLVSVDWTGFAIKDGVQSAHGYITLKSGVQANINLLAEKPEHEVAYSITFYRFKSINKEDEL